MTSNKQFKDKELSSVTRLFSGKYDANYFLDKSERDLARMRKAKDPFLFHDAFIDFSITINHVAEWVWHSKNTGLSLKKFLTEIAKQSAEYRVCQEVANTSKHHTRKSKNHLVDQIKLGIYWSSSKVPHGYMKDCIPWKVGANTVYVLPMLLNTAGDHHRLVHIAQNVVKFWKQKIDSYSNKSRC